jgi:hypothetical protein
LRDEGKISGGKRELRNEEGKKGWVGGRLFLFPALIQSQREE